MIDALTNDDYAELFKIESTSSCDAHRSSNQRLEEDPANKLVNKKILQDNEKIKNDKERIYKGKVWKLRKVVERPQSISRKFSKRHCTNKLQYSFYKILRFLFVSVWFYYVPFIVVVTSNIWPVLSNW